MEVARHYVRRQRPIIRVKHLISCHSIASAPMIDVDDIMLREARRHGMDLSSVMVGESYLQEHDMIEFEIVGFQV